MYRPGIDDPRRGPRAAWPRLSGALDLEALPRDPVGPESSLQIEAVIGRYAWALDERIPNLLGDCFVPDAVVERTIEEERALPRLVGRDAIVRAHRQAWGLSAWAQTRHFLDIALTLKRGEDSAVALSRLLMTRTTEAGPKVIATGFERFELSRQESGWQIESLLVGYDGPGPDIGA
jgi:hypothetical protein